MTMENGSDAEVLRSAELECHLNTMNLADNRFANLHKSNQEYIQTILTESGFALEKRLGKASEHYVAEHFNPNPVIRYVNPWWKFWARSPTVDGFELADIIYVFVAFLEETPEPKSIRWKRLNL